MEEEGKKEKVLTKKELRVLKKQQEALDKAKAEKEAEKAGQEPEKFGDQPMIQSQTMTDRKWTSIAEINPELQQSQIWVRAHLQNIRAKPKIAFLMMRQGQSTIQAVLSQSDEVSKFMIKYAASIPKETVVDVYATVLCPEALVKSTTQKDVELSVHKIFAINKSLPELPFQIEDAARSDTLLKAEGSNYVNVGLDTRLNNRVLDLRTPANQAIFRIQAGVGRFFREFFTARDFVEIHTPKLISGASEGQGANVFNFNYFDTTGCLAQSPQLYKQVACACSGLEKVFEIGPVFRAEDSNTHRHLCEFTGLDFEMVIKEHYYEVLDVFSDLFIHIFESLNKHLAKELAIVNEQHPFEPLKFLKPTLRLTFKEGVDMLRAHGVDQGYTEDLSTVNEKTLGRLVREKYETDFYILDKFPLAVRPFYTMPDPEDNTWSNSYDLMIRGEEIVSGAQRVHDPEFLTERMAALNIPQEEMQWYIDAFKFGAQPHGGGGIGLERVVMLFLGLPNIRKVSMFPRDPKRITP